MMSKAKEALSRKYPINTQRSSLLDVILMQRVTQATIFDKTQYNKCQTAVCSTKTFKIYILDK